jgi:Domain of unknown function (DUF3560)
VITISHTHEDGTLVLGTDKGDGTAAILKAARFRWFPSIKLWGIPQSRDHLAKRWQIDGAAEALRGAGFDVTVEIDDTPRDVNEVKADRAERLEDRREGLTAAAERRMSSAIAHEAAATEIARRRPFGQPILVGHHSERGARADQRRIQRHMDKFCEEYGEAKQLARAASVVGDADAYREHPPVIIRRIAKTEADLRKCRKWMGAGYDPEHYTARIAFLETQLEADRAALKAAEDAGYRCHSRETIHAGDKIVMHGRDWLVVRVNAKSVSVQTPYSWTDTVSYERIRQVICPHATESATA